AARARTDAKVYLGWGIVALKREDYAGAAGRLDRARELFGRVPPPAWFWARALTAACAGEFEVAEDFAEEGAEAYPSHAPLRNNLAVLKELAGDLPAAEDLVREARQNEPSLPQLSKNLGDLAYRGSRYDEAWDAYSRVLDTDPHEYDLLLDALTINVTKCFRNLETWQALAPRLAALWAERHGHVRAWSAGCASGEEPYTLAIALAEAARQLGQESLLEHACVDATDIDRASL